MEDLLQELDYITKAKYLVREYVNRSHTMRPAGWVKYDDIEVVWCTWTEKHWKVFVKVRQLPDERYRVIYDGDQKETYIDLFTMTESRRVPDEKGQPC